jgi:tetratricopeptide (TPR) repeat protein
MTTSLERGPDLALARVHLRLGSLALARAELETMAGQDALDDDGLLDLAEVRWRTGDLTGAGEAAGLALDGNDHGPIIALVVAAEAAAARGRPSEARRLAARALEAAGGSIDGTFAGMPRAPIWPADPAAPPPSPTTLFHAASESAVPVAAPNRAPVIDTSVHSGTLRLWDLPGEPLADDAALPDAEAALEHGRECLASGDVLEAAVHLSLVLRLGPSLAPAVLDLVVDRAERGLALVRGDAYRLVGRELDARRAFADALRREPEPILAAVVAAEPAADLEGGLIAGSQDRPDHPGATGDRAAHPGATGDEADRPVEADDRREIGPDSEDDHPHDHHDHDSPSEGDPA